MCGACMCGEGYLAVALVCVCRVGRGREGEELSGTGLRGHGPSARGTAAALSPSLASEGHLGAGVRDESRRAFEGRRATCTWSAETVSALNLRMCSSGLPAV